MILYDSSNSSIHIYIYISLFSLNRYIIDNMSSRKQRTKQLNSLTFKRVDQLFEISETQSIVKIFIRFIFESKLSFSQFMTDSITVSMTDVQNTVSFSEDINMIDDVTDQNDFSEQIKLRLTIIEIEKKNVFI